MGNLDLEDETGEVGDLDLERETGDLDREREMGDGDDTSS